jgi:hypothetical protein
MTLRNYLLFIGLLYSYSCWSQEKPHIWYAKLEGGYGVGTQRQLETWYGERTLINKEEQIEKSDTRVVLVLPGLGSEIGIKVGRTFNSPIGLELGIQYHRSYQYNFTQITHYYSDTATYYQRNFNYKYGGYWLTLCPTIVFRKPTKYGSFYTSMGFNIGVGNWIRNETPNVYGLDYPAYKKYTMGFNFGLGIEKKFATDWSFCTDFRFNNIFLYHQIDYLGNPNFGKTTYTIPFSNLSLNLGLMYHL